MTSKFLRKLETFELSRLPKSNNKQKLNDTHVAFAGAPVRHPSDDNKVILLNHPSDENSYYYEFDLRDVVFAEEVNNTVLDNGGTIVIATLWVKKQSVGIKCYPFAVETGA